MACNVQVLFCCEEGYGCLESDEATQRMLRLALQRVVCHGCGLVDKKTKARASGSLPAAPPVDWLGNQACKRVGQVRAPMLPFRLLFGSVSNELVSCSSRFKGRKCDRVVTKTLVHALSGSAQLVP